MPAGQHEHVWQSVPAGALPADVGARRSFLLAHVLYAVGFLVGGVGALALLVGVVVVLAALVPLARVIVRAARRTDPSDHCRSRYLTGRPSPPLKLSRQQRSMRNSRGMPCIIGATQDGSR